MPFQIVLFFILNHEEEIFGSTFICLDPLTIIEINRPVNRYIYVYLPDIRKIFSMLFNALL